MGKLAAAIAGLAVLAVLALVLVGPGGSDRATVALKGSDTMVLLGQRWAQAFMKAHPDGPRVEVTGGGTGVGTAALVNGTTDLAMASRPLKEPERKRVRARFELEPVETPVARDGVAFYVHASNPVDTLTVDDLRRIYTGEVTRWSELGGADAPILLYSRENSSGTYAFVKEVVLRKADFASNAQPLPGTAAVVNAVARSANAIGYGGAAYLTGVKEVKVAARAGEPGLLPTRENVMGGRYALSRDLYLVTRGPPAGAARAFVEFVLSPGGQAVVEQVGYYPIR